MNKQYEELRVEQGVYIPQPALDYPQENPFERTLFPKITKDIVFDEHYPYLDDSLGYKLNTLWGYYLVVHILLRLKLRVQMGLRIRGKHILRKYKKRIIPRSHHHMQPCLSFGLSMRIVGCEWNSYHTHTDVRT